MIANHAHNDNILRLVSCLMNVWNFKLEIKLVFSLPKYFDRKKIPKWKKKEKNLISIIALVNLGFKTCVFLIPSSIKLNQNCNEQRSIR